MSDVTIPLAPLSAGLDRAFKMFCSAVLNEQEPSEGDFDEAAFSFFEEQVGQPGQLDLYFSNFTPLWDARLKEGRFQAASNVLNWALRPALA